VFVVAVFALRRWLIYGQWTNPQGLFALNFARGNPVPPWVNIAGIDAWGWANTLGVPHKMRPVIAFAAQHPLKFLAFWGTKVLYQVGINLRDTLWVAKGVVYEIIYFNAVALAGGFIVCKRGWPREAWLPAAFIGLNMISLTITNPYLGGFRLIFPNLIFLSVFAGALLASLEEAWPWRRGRLTHGLVAIALLLTLPFRYGFQYVAMGLAWLVGLMGETRRRRTMLEKVVHELASLPPAAGGTETNYNANSTKES
jgi:hypothetical protein